MAISSRSGLPPVDRLSTAWSVDFPIWVPFAFDWVCKWLCSPRHSFKGGVSVPTSFLVVWVCPCETTITSYLWIYVVWTNMYGFWNWISVYVKSQSVTLHQYHSYRCFHDWRVRNFDNMQIIFKVITGSSGYTFWGGKKVQHCTGERKICHKNHGTGRCLGKFSLLGNVQHLSVP